MVPHRFARQKQRSQRNFRVRRACANARCTSRAADASGHSHRKHACMLRRVYALGHSCTRLRLLTSNCWDEGPRGGEQGRRHAVAWGLRGFHAELLGATSAQQDWSRALCQTRISPIVHGPNMRWHNSGWRSPGVLFETSRWRMRPQLRSHLLSELIRVPAPSA